MMVVVCGIGRCGLSLCMQMLDRGGYPVVGEYPAYEVCQVGDDVAKHRRSNAAIKVVDPKHNKCSAKAKCILLERDCREQAKSQIKFLAALGMPVEATESNIYRMAEANLKDTFANRQRIATWGPVLAVSFENLIAEPMHEAARLSVFVGGGLDLVRMAEQVVERPASCLPWMLESKLIAEAKKAKVQA